MSLRALFAAGCLGLFAVPSIAQDVSVPDSLTVLAGQGDPRLGSNSRHALVLAGVGRFVFVSGGRFVQDRAAGTAHLTGRVVDLDGSGDRGFDVDVTFGGFTRVAPPRSPKLELDPASYLAQGGAIDPSTWYYYQTTAGTLTGVGTLAGAQLTVGRDGPAFQVGRGASGKNGRYGASGWLTVQVDRQPHSGPQLQIGSGAKDFNLDLLGDCVCVGDGVGEPGFWPNRNDFAIGASGLGCANHRWDFVADAVSDRDAVTGEVTIAGEIVNRDDPSCRYCIEVVLADPVGPRDPAGPPAGSPNIEFDQSFLRANGGPIEPADWTFFRTVRGRFVGKGALAGAELAIALRGPAAQVGAGASRDTDFGASGRLNFTVVSQPTQGPTLRDSNGEFDFSFDVCDRPVFTVTPDPLPSVPTVTAACLRLVGTGLDTVTEVRFGNQTITSQDPCDFGRGYFEIESTCALCIHPPLCLPAGTYAVQASNGAAAVSNALDVDVVDPVDPALACPAEWEVGTKPFSVWLHAGDEPNPLMFTIYTPIGDPFVIPGVISLGIAGPLGIYVCGPGIPGPCAEDAFGPIPTSMAGTRVYFQSIVLDAFAPTLPLRTSNVCTTDFVLPR